MKNPWLRVALFVLVLVALFVWAGHVVSRASGSTLRVLPGEGISAENGELLFWGPGKCHTCHAVGTRGRSVRGPNMGASVEEEAIGLRAVQRARERSTALGRVMSGTEYLVESLVDPSVHLVPGFKDEMPVVYQPPIRLTPDELTSVVLYLQSLGGQPDPASIVIPPDVRLSHRDALESTPWEPYLGGDSARGRALFFDPEGPVRCSGCHRIGDEGGDIGPELTSVAGTRTLQSIVESLLQPSASIRTGFEAVLLETVDGRILDGLVSRETPDSLWLVTAVEERYALAQSDIVRRRTQVTSLMPDDLADYLTVRQFHDLVAFLATLQ